MILKLPRGESSPCDNARMITRFSATISLVFLLLVGALFSVAPQWTSVEAQAAPKPSATDRMYLKLDGIDGESLEPNHGNELTLQSFSWGITSTTAPQMNALHVVMAADRAAPLLMRKSATKERITSAVLTVRNGNSQDYMKWTFGNILVTSFQINGGGTNRPTVTVDLLPSKVDVEYRAQLSNGGLGPAVKGSWDKGL
jgi:type VI secretion system secreted protein Hcp